MRKWSFGEASKDRLATCHPDLIAVAMLALEYSYGDFAIACGHRGQAEQDAAFNAGRSEKRWPTGNHNASPSNALDFMPWPDPFPKKETLKQRQRWYSIAGAFYAASVALGIPLRFGMDWDGDRDLTDQTFDDLGHVELVKGG